MGTDAIAILGETALATGAALVLVLALRRPVRAALGANAAYALWLCVPVALAAVLLPRGAEVPLALPAAWQAPAMVVAPAPQPQPGTDWRAWLPALWLAGALGMAALLAGQQRRFRRGLGLLLRRGDGVYQAAAATAGLPAVAGLLRPRILLPADFESRYSERERALVLQHERLHVRRGDLFANALAALLRCLFWFNPLLPFALRRFRLDQELACDEGVIARNPRSRRHYGEAMLKTQFDGLPLPLGCHWQARHPIRERIDMLKRPVLSLPRRMAAVLFALGLSASAGYAAWAAQPAQAASDGEGAVRFLLSRQSGYGDGAASGILNQYVDAGEPAISIIGEGAQRWRNTVRVSPGTQPDTALLRMRIEQGDPGRVVAEPAILLRHGEAGAIEQRDDAGRLVYRSTFRVLPVTGSNQEAQARMEGLMAGDAGDNARPSPGPGDAPAVADDAQIPVTVAEKMPPPVYPAEAARQYIGGEVVLLVTVAADGSPSDVQIEKATPEGVFEAVSLAAARQWRYRPATRDGKPVEGRVRIPITFQATPGDEPASPAAAEEADGYQWLRVPPEALSQAACDIVRPDQADPDAPVHCGIRKAAAR